MKITRLPCGIAVATIVTSQAFAASPSDEAAYAAAGLKRVGQRLVDDCDRPVTPRVRTVNLGGSVGNATVLQIEDAVCYGMAGSRIIILKSEGGQQRPVFDNNSGAIRVLSSRHLGVADIEVGVPGQDIPIWRWNGKEYEFWKQLR